jgi:hypothetical protein
VQNAGLNDRQRPGGLDRVREALEAVAALDADVLDGPSGPCGTRRGPSSSRSSTTAPRSAG